ncbi:heat shock cognate 70 kDa protein 2-like protein, partial [Tanacetum coccineum]
DLVLIDVTPLSLGVACVGDVMAVRSNSNENYYLGELVLDGIPSATRGEVEMNVCFEIDVNGIPNVSAMEITSGRNNSIKITYTGSLSKKEMDKMIEDAERYNQRKNTNLAALDPANTQGNKQGQKHKDREKENWELTHALQTYACKRRAKVKDYKVRLKLRKMGVSLKGLKDVERQIEEAIEWLDDNPNVEIEELANKEQELDELCRRNKLNTVLKD